MDINKEWKDILSSKMYIGVPLSKDAGDKMALIGMTCYLTNALKQKNPNLTHYQVLRMCTKNSTPPDVQIEAIALACEWFAYQCTIFPDFGLKAKEMPNKINDLINNMLPF